MLYVAQTQETIVLANHYLPIMSTLGNGLPLIDHVHCWIHEGVVGVLNVVIGS